MFSGMQSLSLQKRLTIILIVVAFCLIVAQVFIAKFFVYPSYVKLERKKGKTDIERCVNVLGSETRHLNQITHDWAAWDDTYSFTVAPNKEYIFSNLQMSTFVDNEISLLYILSRQGEVVWGKIVDLESSDAVDSTDFQQVSWPLDHELLTDKSQFVRGLFMSDLGPFLIASHPILRTDSSGPAVGTLVIGRLLTDGLIDRLQKQTQVAWSVLPVDKIDRELTPAVVDFLKQEKKNLAFQERRDTLIITTLCDDINGEPGILLRAEISRDITRQGLKTLIFVFWCSMVGVVLMFKLLLTLLNRLIVEPVSALTNHVVTIHDSGNLIPFVRGQRDDDIGTLTKEINRLIRKLSFHQHQLRALSAQILLTEETERRRFARDLHDRIGQNLAVTKIRLDGMAACSSDKTQRIEARKLSTLLGQLIEEARTLTFELSPPMLYELGLCAALEWLIETFQEQHALQINCVCIEVPKEEDTTFSVMVFQIIRELLTNIVKHAKADRVEMKISKKNNRFITDISDNGVGFGTDFDPELTGSREGFGLFSIRERLNSFGGSLKMYSQAGEGTTIIFELPLGEVRFAGNTKENIS